jgi:phenylpropionate dioxygenase-like ring-hydroxylating dioxygenase large terminal subunit
MVMTKTRAPVTIDRDRYTSPEYLRAEVERLWPRVWQMACREEELAHRGDFVEYAVADQSVLLVRGQDGEVRAFRNTCLHRGNQLRGGCGNAGEEIRCRYHLWAWNLDGSLRDVPDRDGFGDLDEANYGLPQLLVDTWGGFVFVHFDPEPPQSLRDYLGDLVAQLGPYKFDEMTCTFNATTPVSANWKVVVEAFLEVYHVQAIHPQLLPMLDDVNTTYAMFGEHSRMIVPFGVPSPRIGRVEPMEIFQALMRAGTAMPDVDDEGPLAALAGPGTTLELPEGTTVRDMVITMMRALGTGRGLDYSGLSDGQMIDDWHFHIFPNLVFNTHAGGFLFFRCRPNGDDPNSSLFDVMTFESITDPELADTKRAAHRFYDELTHSFGEVIDQDMHNLPHVQKGLRNNVPGGVVTISDQEVRIAHMNKVLDRYVAG